MFRKILIGLLIFVSLCLLRGYVLDLIRYYEFLHAVPVAIGVEAGPVKVTLDNATDWPTVFKMLVTVLGTYAGLKIINKYIRA